jgi:hypothetical protein
MELALPRIEGRRMPAELRAIGHWLLCWILLPNLAYWLMWIVGGPPRPLAVLVAGAAGIITHRAPFWAKYAAFVASMLVSAVLFVSTLFNLSVLSLMSSLKFAGELSPSASIEYAVWGLASAATLFAAWKLLRTQPPLGRPVLLATAGCATFLAASLDAKVGDGGRGSYSRTPTAGAPFTSAVKESGLARLATGKRHVLMVMVEAMGQPTDAAVRRRLVDIWARPEVRARYTVTTGDTLFYGSTTNGEMRELCGRWGDYGAVMERRDPSCLPAAMEAKGYRAQAWHSFSGSFFSRTSWYPNVGFSHLRFGPDLMKAGAERCPGVFPGACDRDVPRQIAAELKAAETPQFLYWLTVNSHLPVLSSEKLGTTECERFDARLAADFPMTCRLLQLFDDSGRALAKEISADDFPEADILIVGDHLPPFFDRRNRERFEPDRVPWILLRRKAPAESSAAH